MIYLARRNPALAPQAFAQAWREHSALGRSCRNVQDRVLAVAQCSRVLDLALPGACAEHDGVALLALRDARSAQDIWNDPETLAVMRPDEPRVFAGYVRDFALVGRERVLRPGVRGTCAVIAFLRRRAPLSKADFDAAWCSENTACWLDAPALRHATRIVHGTVEGTPPPGYEFDGIAEWWFDTPAAAVAAFGPVGIPAGLPGALSGLADIARSVFMFTQVTHSRP
jgi:hypothetical protein